MKIAIVFHPSLPARPFDFANLQTSERGLTGSEGSSLGYATAMAARGHDVEWLGPATGDSVFGDVKVSPCVEPYMSRVFEKERWDAVVAWNTDEVFRGRPLNGLRILNMQVSDFGWCSRGWEAHADIFCPLSLSHAQHMISQTGYPSNQWRIMPNGVDLTAFRPGLAERVPGRVLWASSHDRGLHHLLAVWPRVRRAIPHAELNVLYDTSGLHAHSAYEGPDALMLSLKQRATWSLEALQRLESHGVRLIGSVSRERVAKEMAAAEVLAYPCEPVRYCETFGVSVLEAMASGCVPVLSTADAFGELWCPVAPNVSAPVQSEQYGELLVAILRDHAERERYAKACQAHAQRFAWAPLAERLEKCIATRGVEGLVNPWG